MPRNAHTYLWEARRAAELIRSFVRDRTEHDIASDLLLRSAVERQFEVIGEALGQLGRHHPTVADRIEDLPRIVAFRNILVHGYATVDVALVWEAATTRVAPLIGLLDELLDDPAIGGGTAR
ncbi:MAG: DUF86 domain-containing protein [Actinobacteria bacterium]|nr:DUF86 domain-containing protein [Actinomycetota bacterium]